MRKKILERYTRTPDNKLIIDIATSRIEDLYNNFDKHSPYVKRELDQDLVEYLINTINEIGNEEFIIQFRINSLTDPNATSRVKASVQNYFLYLKELELRELTRMARTSVILFSIGIIILIVSVWVKQNLNMFGDMLNHVFAEGLTVAAWVSLWNALATFLISWAPHRRNINIYERISKSNIVFEIKAQDENEAAISGLV